MPLTPSQKWLAKQPGISPSVKQTIVSQPSFESTINKPVTPPILPSAQFKPSAPPSEPAPTINEPTTTTVTIDNKEITTSYNKDFPVQQTGETLEDFNKRAGEYVIQTQNLNIVNQPVTGYAGQDVIVSWERPGGEIAYVQVKKERIGNVSEDIANKQGRIVKITDINDKTVFFQQPSSSEWQSAVDKAIGYKETVKFIEGAGLPDFKGVAPIPQKTPEPNLFEMAMGFTIQSADWAAKQIVGGLGAFPEYTAEIGVQLGVGVNKTPESTQQQIGMLKQMKAGEYGEGWNRLGEAWAQGKQNAVTQLQSGDVLGYGGRLLQNPFLAYGGSKLLARGMTYFSASKIGSQTIIRGITAGQITETGVAAMFVIPISKQLKEAQEQGRLNESLFQMGYTLPFYMEGYRIGSIKGKMEAPKINEYINTRYNEAVGKIPPEMKTPVDYIGKQVQLFEIRSQAQRGGLPPGLRTPITTIMRRALYKAAPPITKYYMPQLSPMERIQFEQGPIGIMTRYRYRHSGYEKLPIRNIMTEANPFREPTELSFPTDRIVFMPRKEPTFISEIKMEHGKTRFNIDILDENISRIGEITRQQQIRNEPTPIFETTIRGYDIQRQIKEEPVYRMFETKTQSEYLSDKTQGDWIISTTRGTSETKSSRWGRIIDQDILLSRKQQNVFMDITAAKDIEIGTQFFRKSGKQNILSRTEAKETDFFSLSRYRTEDYVEGKTTTIGRIRYEKPPKDLKSDFGGRSFENITRIPETEFSIKNMFGSLKEEGASVLREAYNVPRFQDYLSYGTRKTILVEEPLVIAGYWKGIISAPTLTKTISKNKQEQKTGNINLVSLASMNIVGIKLNQDIINLSDIKTETMTMQEMKTETIQQSIVSPVVKTSQVQQQMLKQMTMQITIPKTSTKYETIFTPYQPATPTFTPNKPWLPDFPDIDLLKAKTRGTDKEQQQGYAVMVKDRTYVKGKKRYAERFIQLFNQPLNRQDALSLGANAVDNSAAATFYIRPMQGKPKQLPFNVDPWGTLQNMFYNKNGKYIEETSYRINTPGEIKGISARGWIAERRRQQPKTSFRAHKNIKLPREQYNMGLPDIDAMFKKMFKGGDSFGL